MLYVYTNCCCSSGSGDIGEGGVMTLKEIREIAKQKGVKAGKLKKDELVRAIQLAEGNFDCFGTACSGECSQEDCFWRSDCLGS
jgi:hypothetical protein